MKVDPMRSVEPVLLRIGSRDWELPRRVYRMISFVARHSIEIGNMQQGSLVFDFGGESLTMKLTQSGLVTDELK